MEGLDRKQFGEIPNRDLAGRTTLRVGGVADRLFAPHTIDELTSWMRSVVGKDDTFVHVLGAGSNVLVQDGRVHHYTLLMTRLLLGYFCDEHSGEVVAPAGVPMPLVARDAANRGISGFGFLAGIPGTVGGGVFMNAGTGGLSGPSLEGLIEWVDVLDRYGTVSRETRDTIEFGYRSSVFQSREQIILRVGMRGCPGAESDVLWEEIQSSMARRRRTQPRRIGTAGSVFLPLADGRPAGEIIDQMGLKGLSCGKARVSLRHANWIETEQGATAADVKGLIVRVSGIVHCRTGVTLKRELRFFPEEATRIGVLRDS